MPPCRFAVYVPTPGKSRVDNRKEPRQAQGMVENEKQQGREAEVSRRHTPAIRVVTDVRTALARVGEDVRKVVTSLPQGKFVTPTP